MAEHVQEAKSQFSGRLSLGSRSPRNMSATTVQRDAAPSVAGISRTPKQRGVAVGSAQPGRRENTTFNSPIPPDALVKTWAWMWKSGPSPEVSQEGRSRLITVFGSLEVASAYINTLGSND